MSRAVTTRRTLIAAADLDHAPAVTAAATESDICALHRGKRQLIRSEARTARWSGRSRVVLVGEPEKDHEQALGFD